MENHTGQSGNFPKEDPPLKLIVDLCAQLADMGLEFQISLKIKDSLQFSLKSDNKASGQSAGGKRRRGASYRRRQMRRRAAYLEKKRDCWKRGGGVVWPALDMGPNTDILERRSKRIGG